MSWEYERFEARCDDCGHVGVCVRGSDDWGRFSTSWEGFKNKSPDPTAVARKHVDARDSVPICKCGSTKISVGRLLGKS